MRFARICAMLACIYALPPALHAGDGIGVTIQNGVGNTATVAMEDMRSLCAVNTGYMVMRLAGRNAGYMELYRELYPFSDSMVSILDLEKALNVRGIRTDVSKVKAKKLLKRPGVVFIMYTPPPRRKPNRTFQHFAHFGRADRTDNRSSKLA